jgi:hypothetical protein
VVDSRTPLSVDDELDAAVLPLKQTLDQNFAGYGNEFLRLSIEKSFGSPRVVIPSCGCEMIFSMNAELRQFTLFDQLPRCCK